MRYRGKIYTGKGIRVAVIDSGIDRSDPRLKGANIEGWSIELSATNHALLKSDFEDENGHGTEIAAAIHSIAPDATLVAVKIMGERLRVNTDLMAAGIETSSNSECRVINLSLGTKLQTKNLMLNDCVGNAMRKGSLILAATHPQGKLVYPAGLPDVVGVASHPKCPIDRFFYFNPKRFPRKKWDVLSGNFLAHGINITKTGEPGRFRGPTHATAYLSGYVACLAEALPKKSAHDLLKELKRLALTPTPEFGYD